MNSTLLCRVENGEEYVPSFLAHYRSLGVSQMIFLDTGSTDRTLEMLHGDDVTVHRTDKPFKTHRLEMRRWLMDLCEPGTWTINVDIDELFLFPSPIGGGVRGGGDLPLLIEYLDHHHFTALRTLTLDMLPSGPIGSRDASPDSPLIDQYPWCDLSDVETFQEPLFGSQLPAYRGGIRKTLTGRPHFWLTKHPLIKTGSGVKAFEDNEHSVSGENLADVTGVLLHFKFTPRFRQYVNESVQREQHWNLSEEYKLYQHTLEENPNLTLRRSTSEKWNGIDPIITKGLVCVSDAYREWARRDQASGQASDLPGETRSAALASPGLHW